MNAFTYTHRTAARFMAVLAVFSLLMSMVPMQAFAVNNPVVPTGVVSANTQIDICHNNNGASDYSIVQSKASAIIEETNAGHPPTAAHGGDIIPPFQYNFGNGVLSYPGRNWQDAATFMNGCVVPPAPKSIDLSVTKVASDTTPDEAQTVVYTIEVSNAGPDAASNVVLTDNVPAGTSFVSATPVQTGSGPYTWNLGSIANGASKTVTVTVTVNAATGGDKITNTASVTATETDSNTSNNTVSEDIVVNIPPVLGCTDPNAYNYNPAATEDDNSCVPKVFGCTDSDANNYNSAANVDDNSCKYDVRGCMNPAATNYNPLANVEDNSCIFPEVPGCTDPNAYNYNPAATEDDNSCVPKVFGCTDSDALNYEPDANVDDQSCEYEVLGCTDPDANNYNPLATLGNPEAESCSYDPEVVLGCTDPDALNYNPLATSGNADAEKCTYDNGPDPVYGCTDRTATNFDPKANTNDQSCEYDYVSQCVSINDAPVVNLLQNGSFETPVVTANGGTYEIFSNVANWTIGLSDGLELWKGLGIGASDGLQNAELDGNDATKITQDVATISGATYELRFDFAARTADKADNNVNALVEGAVVENANSANTNWTTYGTTFVATDASTEIGFEDIGTAQAEGGTGSLIDNAVVCLVELPDEEEEETPSCELTASDTSIRRGSDVTLSWDIVGDFAMAIITNNQNEDEDPTDEATGSTEAEDINRDTTYTLTVYGDYVEESNESEEREVIAECDVDIDVRTGGGGGGRRDRDDDDEPTPTPQVLGEQVSVVPLGAADAGAGSTSPMAIPSFGLAAAAFIGRSRK